MNLIVFIQWNIGNLWESVSRRQLSGKQPYMFKYNLISRSSCLKVWSRSNVFAVDSIGPQEQEPFQVREVVGGHRIGRRRSKARMPQSGAHCLTLIQIIPKLSRQFLAMSFSEFKISAGILGRVCKTCMRSWKLVNSSASFPFLYQQ